MSRYELVPRVAASLYPGLPEPARRVLRLCDGTRDSTRICADSGLPTAAAARVLDRLVGLGAVIRSAVRARKRRMTPTAIAWLSGAPLREKDFTDDEDAFFAQSIDHLIAED